MKENRKPRKTTGVLLIVILAYGMPVAALLFDRSDVMGGTATMVCPLKIIEAKTFKTTPAAFEFSALFDVWLAANVKGKETVRSSNLDLRILNFPIAAGIFSADVLEPTGGDSDRKPFRFFNPDLFRIKGPDEPIPTPALLILIGLVAIIALKGRRK